MPGKKTRLAAVLGATLLASALALPSAHAQTVDSADTTATITGGFLTLSDITVGNFADRTVTGAAQTTTATLDGYSVTDLRGGVGGGWQLSAQATQFEAASGDMLPASSLSMAAPTVAPADATNPALPPLLTPAPTGHTLDGLLPATVATAAAGVPVLPGVVGVPSGTGVWDFSSAGLTLNLPANVVPGTYTSTVTMTLSAGPG